MSYIGNQPAQGNIQTTDIANLAVTTAKLDNGAATLAKMDTTGLSGRVLTAQGVGVPPVWAAIAAGNTIVGIALLTSGTSFATPAGCTKMVVELVGGGGGGAGVSSGVTGDVGGGGASGAYAMKLFTVSPSTTYNYTIGAGGGGSASSVDGTSGGATSITVGGVTVLAGGGNGGKSSLSLAAAAGGTATGGDINLTGMSGSTSTASAGADQLSFGGTPLGGFGQGGMSATLAGSSNGTPGFGYGSGGSGGRCVSAGVAATGGAGAGGAIRVYCFA